jgi:molybdopterin molybdotransferase
MTLFLPLRAQRAQSLGENEITVCERCVEHCGIASYIYLLRVLCDLRGYYFMLTVEEALELVAKHAATLAPRKVPLGDAAGLVLAEDVVSEGNSPPYNKTVMDGYAVRSGDRQPERRVLEEIGAGAVPRHHVTPGTATRIMTGAPMPEGADAVVPIEKSEMVDATTVRLQQVDPPPGQHVMPLGASMRAGDVVLRAGAVVRPIEIAILAEIGRAMATVRPRPRVAILPTGNELVAIGEKPGQGQIRNSNGPMLVAAAASAGAEAIELGIARDERDELSRWIEQGLAADVLLLSGGVSAGKFDLVPAVLADLGIECVFHKVSLRPGKPLWFGTKQDAERRVLVFGLPGNPVSSFVCFELFVRPAIAALAGRGFTQPNLVTAQLSHEFDHPGGRAAYLPARFDISGDVELANVVANVAELLAAAARPCVEILPWQGSADLATLAHADLLAYLPAEKCHLAIGAPIKVMMI